MSRPVSVDEAVRHPRLPEVPRGPAALWVRSLLGFGVAVGVGLAPLLGKTGLPGFFALLSMLPEVLRTTAIPLSSFIMGILAVGVQFYGRHTIPSKVWLRRAFRITIILLCVFVFVYFVAHALSVQVVPVDGGNVPLVVGFSERLETCPCTKAASDLECIMGLSMHPAAIATCFGSRNIALANGVLVFVYLATMGLLGVLVGLLVLMQAKKPSAQTAPAIRKREPLIDACAPKEAKVTHPGSIQGALQLDASLGVLSDAGNAALQIVLAELEVAKASGRLAPTAVRRGRGGGGRRR